ncbi:ribbon-helix-helix domain-containing protein [Anabaena sp. WFMT]|uniref:ribbon-helix-helix domain-containing protein n=1 Tax=Anabaena sp. WFMT TaxID=3449730 RepID=UPI003F23EBB8
MTTLNSITLPDKLYKELQKLAEAENDSIESQIVALLQNALQEKQKKTEAQRRNNVLKVLEESRLRRRLNPADFGLPDSTEMIREDRKR